MTEGSCGETLEAMHKDNYFIKGTLHLKEVGFQLELPFQ